MEPVSLPRALGSSGNLAVLGSLVGSASETVLQLEKDGDVLFL